MKKWLITYGLISFLNVAGLVVIYFWIGEPLNSYSRNNHPLFLAFFTYLSLVWFSIQSLSLLYFWKKIFAGVTSKIVSCLFYLICTSLLLFAVYDILFFYIREGFRVAWYQVYSSQLQIDFFIHHAVYPLFLVYFILLFFSITGFALSIRKKETQKFLIPWLAFSILPFICMVIWVGFILYTDVTYEFDPSINPLYFTRVSLMTLSSIITLLLTSSAQNIKQSF